MCQQCGILRAENEKLREKIEEYEEMVKNLQNLGSVKMLPVHLSAGEFRILRALARASPRIVFNRVLEDQVRRDINHEPNAKSPQVMVCRIRKALKPLEISIKTARGTGYWMDKESKDRFTALTE